MAVNIDMPPARKNTGWKFWQKISWTRRNRLIAGSIGVFLILLSIGLAWNLIFPEKQVATTSPTPTPTAAPTPVPKDHENPLNGMLYTAAEAAAWEQKRPIGVMIENHVQARPQAGISQADVVYEAMAEGGITRFMAFYLANSPDKIGPVRSARQHFVNWAAEYDAAYAHWGGSAGALDYLHSHNRPVDIDQFRYASAFWRDFGGGRSLEHTGYTAISRLRSVLQRLGAESPSNFTPWQFTDDALVEDRPANQTVKLNFLGTFGYAAQFEYRPESNDYIRATGGKAHVDANGEQITVKTIVIMYQNVRSYTDSGGHPAVDVSTNGQGAAVVIADGKAVAGTWSKPSINERTQLLDDAGQPIKLTRGKLWVISAPAGSSVSY